LAILTLETLATLFTEGECTMQEK